MDREQVIKELQSSADSRVKLAVVDIDGILRGKVIHKEKLFDALENNLGFCDVIFGWDSEDQLYQRSKVTGWHTGFPDAKARIDLSTYRKIPWEEDIPFFLADFSHTSHPACPRSLLKKVISKAKDMGFDPVFAAEFEWFNFLRPEERTDVFARPQPMTSGMFGYSVLRASQKSGYFNDLFTQLEAFGIPMEGIHTETGPGVYEACIRSTDILEAADRAVIFKTAVKEIASRHGLVASFMAKWNATLPGCSGHLHQSLWKNGRNVFFDSKSDNHMSIVMRQYIAGQLACMSDVLPMYAPTINSYKRLVEGAWAPTHVTWGIDNRTTALRVINGRENSTRLENRAAGSDINPYLAMAGALASGLYGIEKELSLEAQEVVGNAYNFSGAEQLPRDLHTAVSKMKASKLAQTLFGKEFVEHFVMTREWEQQQFASQVTDWELKRYFEII